MEIIVYKCAQDVHKKEMETLPFGGLALQPEKSSCRGEGVGLETKMKETIYQQRQGAIKKYYRADMRIEDYPAWRGDEKPRV